MFDKKVIELLDMDIIHEDGTVTFSDVAKNLIHEICEECLSDGTDSRYAEMEEEYSKGLSAEDVFVDMINKIANAPTSPHCWMSLKLLLPVIDRKIQNGEAGFRYQAEGKEKINGEPFRWGGFERAFGRTAKEWQQNGGIHYERCHLCKQPFHSDEHLYCATFKQPEGGMRFRILCRKCAYSFGKVIEPEA